MNRLLETLDRVRKSEGLSNKQLAQKLGVSPTMLIFINQGKRRPGLRFLRALLQQYPEMSFIVHEYIAAGDGKG